MLWSRRKSGEPIKVRPCFLTPRLEPFNHCQNTRKRRSNSKSERPEGDMCHLIEGELARTSTEHDGAQRRLQVPKRHGAQNAASHGEPCIAIACADLRKHSTGAGARDGDADPE